MGNFPNPDPLWRLVGRPHDVFYTGHARSHGPDHVEPGLGRRRIIHPASTVFLADRAAVLYSAWDLCAPAERVLFDLHQSADGSFRATDQRLVCDLLVPPFDRIRLPVERPDSKFMDDAGRYRRARVYHDGVALGKLCLLSRHECVAPDGF